MKNQIINKVVNFIAFNLLFFALYLNFIHQDTTSAENNVQRIHTERTKIVNDPDVYLQKATTQHAAANESIVHEQTGALQLSFN